MARRVLVTRPEPGASKTAHLLAQLGVVPVVLPLSETVPLPVDTCALAATPAVVAVTSANALRHAAPELRLLLAPARCFAVGARTAAAAREAGFHNVIAGQGDAHGLARRIIAEHPADPIVYLCGRVRRPDFEVLLADGGIAVAAVETYDTLPTVPAPEAVSAALGARPVDAVLLYSAGAASAFQELAARPSLAGFFETTQVFCLSARIAEALDEMPSIKIHVALEPTEEALLSRLQNSR